jgi:predicted acylesterase/phospholipase RssA
LALNLHQHCCSATIAPPETSTLCHHESQIRRAPKIALALAGGGPLGAIYEIGALCALEESLDGLNFTHLHHYVGVSAGGFIAAGLANGMSPPRTLRLVHPERQPDRSNRLSRRGANEARL